MVRFLKASAECYVNVMFASNISPTSSCLSMVFVCVCSLSLQCLRTLVGHTGGVWSSQMRDNIIISGSTDRTLKVWDAETGECIHTLPHAIT